MECISFFRTRLGVKNQQVRKSAYIIDNQLLSDYTRRVFYARLKFIGPRLRN